jgi:hypothetical protein
MPGWTDFDEEAAEQWHWTPSRESGGDLEQDVGVDREIISPVVSERPHSLRVSKDFIPVLWLAGTSTTLSEALPPNASG